MKKIMKGLLLLICIALAMQNVFALSSCITLSTGGTKEITTPKDTPNYVSLRIYNSSAEGSICEQGIYSLKAELIQVNGKTDILVKSQLSSYFDYSFNANEFTLLNGENKQVLWTLTPKKSGTYVIKVTATKNPSAVATGASIVSTTSALINVTVLGEVDATNVEEITETQEVPFWTTHKNCPDGTVVEKTASCPEINAENVFVAQDKNVSADQNTPTALAGFSLNGFGLPSDMGTIFVGGLVLVVGGCLVMFVPNRLKKGKEEIEPEESPKQIILEPDAPKTKPIVSPVLTPIEPDSEVVHWKQIIPQERGIK